METLPDLEYCTPQGEVAIGDLVMYEICAEQCLGTVVDKRGSVITVLSVKTQRRNLTSKWWSISEKWKDKYIEFRGAAIKAKEEADLRTLKSRNPGRILLTYGDASMFGNPYLTSYSHISDENWSRVCGKPDAQKSQPKPWIDTWWRKLQKIFFRSHYTAALAASAKEWEVWIAANER